MTQTIRASSPAHLLASLPLLAGFSPRDSLVIVPFSGTSSCGLLRMDLPAPSEADQVAATAVGTVCRVQDVDAIAVVVYADAPLRDGAGVVHEALVSAVSERAETCGIEVREELCVARDGWCRYADRHALPLQEIARESRDLPDAPSHDQRGAGIPTPSTRDQREVAAALAAFPRAARSIERPRADASPVSSDPHATVRIERATRDLAQFFEDTLNWEIDGADPYSIALVLWLIDHAPTRDLAITTWCGGVEEGRAVENWQRRWEKDRSLAPEAPIRLAGEGPRPTGDRLRRARRLMRRVASLAPAGRSHAALTVCGWLAWGMGNASQAHQLIRGALDERPTYGLANLMDSLIDGGFLPGWVFSAEGSPLGVSERARREPVPQV